MKVLETLENRLAVGALELPPLPAIAHQVLALAADPDASSADMASLVHRDAGLAAAVLRRSNSAALGGVNTITSLHQAIARLGMRSVGEIAFAASVRDAVFASVEYAALVEDAWRRSLATGLYAKEIARELRSNVETAFLCGLLWRVGRPLVLHGLREVCSEQRLPDEFEAAELAEALDGAFAAAAAEAWRLPAVFATAVDARERGRPAPVDGQIAGFAERLADLALEEADDDLAAGQAPSELNLYPESVEALRALAPGIRSDIEDLA